ncbi:MAG TPA: ribosome silencing factor [Bacteroidia bacterium]|nr:ribosome silencing factor [Bacteroidia bacterium]
MAKKKVVKKSPVKAKAKTKKAAVPAKGKKAPAKKSTVKTKTAAVKKPAAVKKVVAKVVAKPVKAKPVTPKEKDEGRILAESVIEGILEKKGQNIRWLDLRKIENAVCDYFIICEGGSNTQVEAIAGEVEHMVKRQTGERPYRSEGWENALWILIDYVDVVVHVFERDTRDFYKLEALWADAEEIKVKQ